MTAEERVEHLEKKVVPELVEEINSWRGMVVGALVAVLLLLGVATWGGIALYYMNQRVDWLRGRVAEQGGVIQNTDTWLQTQITSIQTQITSIQTQVAGLEGFYAATTQKDGTEGLSPFQTKVKEIAVAVTDDKLGAGLVSTLPSWYKPRSFEGVPANPDLRVCMEAAEGLFSTPDQIMSCCEVLPDRLQTQCRQGIQCQLDPVNCTPPP